MSFCDFAVLCASGKSNPLFRTFHCIWTLSDSDSTLNLSNVTQVGYGSPTSNGLAASKRASSAHATEHRMRLPNIGRQNLCGTETDLYSDYQLLFSALTRLRIRRDFALSQPREANPVKPEMHRKFLDECPYHFTTHPYFGRAKLSARRIYSSHRHHGLIIS